jgi:3-hydroxyisobutyrate dehydrogenase-like beta-hydroxyacid dehydrogenase
MGCGIIKNLRKAAVPVVFVVHRNRGRVTELEAAGAREVPDCRTLAAESDVVMLTLPDSSVVEPMLLGEGGLGPHLRSGQIVADMSTSYPPSTRRIAQALAGRGVALLDAPLTGSRPQAEAGTLTVIGAGDRKAFDAAKPLFEKFASRVFYAGGSGIGHTIKLINNFLGQAAVAALCEAFPLARKCGVDPQAIYDVVSVSGGDSRAFQSLMPRLMRRDFGVAFQQKFVQKDVRYVTELAREQRAPMPLAAALLAIHDAAAAAGFGEQDFSSLVKLWEAAAGGGAPGGA